MDGKSGCKHEDGMISQTTRRTRHETADIQQYNRTTERQDHTGQRNTETGSEWDSRDGFRTTTL